MLNDAKLRSAKPRDKAYKLTDSHRLYLLVKPTGGKLWRWNYSYGGKRKSMNFAVYPLVSLVQARDKRNEARAILDKGKDPAITKKLAIEENRKAAERTFELVATEWHEAFNAQWAVAHAHDVIRSLERDVFPAIGKYPITDLTPPIVLKVLRALPGPDRRAPRRVARRALGRIRGLGWG